MRGDFRQNAVDVYIIFHSLKRSGGVTPSPRDPLEQIHDCGFVSAQLAMAGV